MDTPMLHLVGPARDGSTAMIAGDIAALMRMRAAIEAAIKTGTGSAQLFCSDGEPYDLMIIASSSMHNVYTAYAGETGPVRSRRELLSLARLCGLPGATG